MREILCDSFMGTYEELLQNGVFDNFYNLHKFLYQMLIQINEMQKEEIIGYYISRNNIVYDSNLNFKLTGFDINLNDSFFSEYWKKE